MRENSLCRGEEKQQRGCHLANRVACVQCKNEWQVDDTGPSTGRLSAYVGNCASCGSSAITLLRCDSCPVAELERVRSNTSAGRLLERVLELDFDTERFAVGWAEVTCEEAMGIKVLKQEREKWRAEAIEDQRREAELQRAEMEAKQRSGRGGF